jgi:hypothetical protein
MKYTSIELSGARARAAITGGDDPGSVRIALRLPGGGGEERTAGVADGEERWRTAAWLQQALEGYRGAGGDVREVAMALDLVAGV